MAFPGMWKRWKSAREPSAIKMKKNEDHDNGRMWRKAGWKKGHLSQPAVCHPTISSLIPRERTLVCITIPRSDTNEGWHAILLEEPNRTRSRPSDQIGLEDNGKPAGADKKEKGMVEGTVTSERSRTVIN